MANIRSFESGGGEPADGDRSAPSDQLVEERLRGFDLGSGRPAVRRRCPGMRGHDVPEQHLVLDSELREHAVNDRRGRLRGARARQLPFGSEGNSADSGTSVAGGLADKDNVSSGSRPEIVPQSLSEGWRVGVLVEGLADLGCREPLYEAGGYSHSIVAGGFDVTSSTTRLTPGISLMILAEIVSTRSYGSRAQSAVMASSLVTARITIG